MSIYAVEPSDLVAAAGAATSAADDVRGHDGSDELSRLHHALPGSIAGLRYPQLGSAWRIGIEAWADDVDAFAAAARAAAIDAGTADRGAADSLGRVLALLGGAG